MSPHLRGLSALLFAATIKKVCEAAGDIIHLSLLGGNIAVAVYIEGSPLAK